MRVNSTLFALVLTTALAASSHSFADGAYLVVSTPQAPCGSILVIGDNNTINCTAQSDERDTFIPAPHTRRAAPACVTPNGNYPMREALPYYTGCWVPDRFGGVAGWTGDASDNFFYPPF